jgi:uncharacterized protein DUF3618
VAERNTTAVRAEIEQARDQLAVTIDQIAERLDPTRIADRAKASLREKLTSPVGMAVVGGTAALLTVLVVRNLRRSRR